MSALGIPVVSERSSVWRVIYGCSCGCAVFSGVVGRASPGLATLVMYLALFWIIVEIQRRNGSSLVKTAGCVIGIAFFIILPARLVGVSFRELGAVSFRLEALANASITFWIMVGVSAMIVQVFAKGRAVEERSPSGL